MKLSDIYESRYYHSDAIIDRLQKGIATNESFKKRINKDQVNDVLKVLTAHLGEPTHNDECVWIWQYPEVEVLRSDEDEGEVRLFTCEWDDDAPYIQYGVYYDDEVFIPSRSTSGSH